MNDDPFAAFKEGEPPVEDKPKNGRKKRAKKAVGYKVGDTVTVKVTGAGKKVRKPKAAKELKLPISTLLELGPMTGEEAGVLLEVSAKLRSFSKRSRQRVALALGKLFS
jgi:hypothetical protein